MVTLDLTITAGNIIEICIIAGGGIVTFAMLRSRVIDLAFNMGEVKTDIRALNKIMIQMAVADQRLLALEQDIREMRHGKGFIEG